MLKDCIEIFNKKLKSVEVEQGNADKLILDTYMPAEGCYLIVRKDGRIDHCEIKLERKTRQLMQEPLYRDELWFYDYHSQLVSMDKPQDPKKVIHSNNYLSFWVKQESFKNNKLNPAAIDRYFDALVDPREKYSKPKDREMYEYIVDQVGEVDQERLERSRTWIKEHIFRLEDLGIELVGKNYLKIFFEEAPELYTRENRIYLIPKIYNKNDYNLKIGDEIWGLPNNNMGMNSKKPFMENRTRKITLPYLVKSEEILEQKKFFDYLMNMASAGKNYIFFDEQKGDIYPCSRDAQAPRDFSGYFLQIKKGKEVEIHHQDVVVDYHIQLRKRFDFQNVLGVEDKEELYKQYGRTKEMEQILDDVLFSKWLVSNYFTVPEEIQVDGVLKRVLVRSRERIFAWMYKGMEEGIDKVLLECCMDILKSSIVKDHIKKAQKQLNLMYSLEAYFMGGKQMGTVYQEVRARLREKINQKESGVIDSDREYYYAVGQLVSYFISLNKGKDKMHSLANPFFNAKTDQKIKEKLRQFFMKYNYQLQKNGGRFNQLFDLVFNYIPEASVDQTTIIAGYISSSLLYEKKQEDE